MWRRAWLRCRPRTPALLALTAAPCLPARCDDEDWRAKAQRLELEVTELRKRLPHSEPHSEEARVYTVVLTGGPCAGKTTAAAVLKEKLENLGFLVFLVPEAATLFFGAGVKVVDFVPLGEQAIAAVQEQITRTQLQIENCFRTLARMQSRPVVILCDRGAMDGKAYVSAERWSLILEDLGATETALRDRRYDAVLHLVTAARGAEESYSLQQVEGVGARTESVEEAVVQDEKTLRSWVGHPHLFVVDNSTDFNSKIQRAVDRVLHFLGKSVAGHTLRKFRFAHVPASELVHALSTAGISAFRIFHLEQVFLTPTRRIRMRCSAEKQQAFYCVQEQLDIGALVERQISGRDYLSFRSAAVKAGMPVVEKELVVFEWNGHVMEVNIFSTPEPVCIVEVEAESPDAFISFPAFLLPSGDGHGDEVTEDPRFDSYAISERLRGRAVAK